MLDNQQLFKQIPKQVSQWTQQDVAKWFNINDIEIPPTIKINGQQFMQLTPSKMINELKLSNFLTRKIADWIQFSIQDFNEYTSSMSLNLTQQQPQIFVRQEVTFQKQVVTQDKKDSNEREKLVNYKSQQHLKESSLRLKKQKSENDNISFAKVQTGDQLEKIMYQPLKYKAHKGSDKKNNFLHKQRGMQKEREKQKANKFDQSIKVKPFFHNKADMRKALVLKDLQENQDSTKQQVETFKHLPQNLQYPQNSQYFGDLSSIPKPEQESQWESSIKSNPKQRYENNVRFVSSQLMRPDCVILSVQFENNLVEITKATKIGRSTSNNIILKSDGVSRNHAQITIEEQNDQNNASIKRFYLKDVGSKFGTFVQVDPERAKKVSEGQHYCIGQTTIRIDKIKVNKSRQKFDICLSVIQNQSQQRSYLNKSVVTIGNKRRQSSSKQGKSTQVTKRCTKQKRDIQIQDPQIKNSHCRFIILDGQVYLEQVQGNFMQKIEKDIPYQFVRKNYQVRFGDENVFFKIDNFTVQLLSLNNEDSTSDQSYSNISNIYDFLSFTFSIFKKHHLNQSNKHQTQIMQGKIRDIQIKTQCSKINHLAQNQRQNLNII